MSARAQTDPVRDPEEFVARTRDLHALREDVLLRAALERLITKLTPDERETDTFLLEADEGELRFVHLRGDGSRVVLVTSRTCPDVVVPSAGPCSFAELTARLLPRPLRYPTWMRLPPDAGVPCATTATWLIQAVAKELLDDGADMLVKGLARICPDLLDHVDVRLVEDANDEILEISGPDTGDVRRVTQLLDRFRVDVSGDARGWRWRAWSWAARGFPACARLDSEGITWVGDA